MVLFFTLLVGNYSHCNCAKESGELGGDVHSLVHTYVFGTTSFDRSTFGRFTFDQGSFDVFA